ncbi:MAG: hypothetical protein ABW075_03935 [Aeromicrobium sp.]
MSRGVALAITVVVTVLAGWAGWSVATGDVPDPLPVGDRVDAVVEALRASNVYVDPDSADLLTDEDLARIDAAAAASSPEAFVVVWEYTSEGGFYLENEGLRQIGAELGRPGLYVSIGRSGISSQDVGIDGDYVSAQYFDEGEEITPESVAAKISALLAENDGREFSEETSTGSAYWGGPFGTLAAGVLIGVMAGLGLAIVVVALWFIVRSRLRSRS